MQATKNTKCTKKHKADGVHLSALRVLYEFVEEGQPDNSENLLSPAQLEPGQVYSMVVSNGYGLRRYQTGDLFQCTGSIANVPCLEFMRRRDLEYSSTGEKLTGQQLTDVFQRMRERFGLRESHFYLTCVPSFPASATFPP